MERFILIPKEGRGSRKVRGGSEGPSCVAGRGHVYLCLFIQVKEAALYEEKGTTGWG